MRLLNPDTNGMITSISIRRIVGESNGLRKVLEDSRYTSTGTLEVHSINPTLGEAVGGVGRNGKLSVDNILIWKVPGMPDRLIFVESKNYSGNRYTGLNDRAKALGVLDEQTAKHLEEEVIPRLEFDEEGVPFWLDLEGEPGNGMPVMEFRLSGGFWGNPETTHAKITQRLKDILLTGKANGRDVIGHDRFKDWLDLHSADELDIILDDFLNVNFVGEQIAPLSN